MADYPRDRPHLHIEGGGQSEQYRVPPRRIERRPFPFRNRTRHARALEAAIGTAIQHARAQLQAREEGVAEGLPGFYLDVAIPSEERAVIDQLADQRRHMEVVAVRDAPFEQPGAALTTATVFVPERAIDHYLDKVEKYRTTVTPAGRPTNEALVSRIETVHLATVRSLFTDSPELLPGVGQAMWWEVWVRTGLRESFMRVAAATGLQVREHFVTFREREVVLAHGTEDAIARALRNSDAIAELRAAKDSPSFFLGLDGAGQRDWVDEVLERLQEPGDDAPAVCLLDSGVTQAHPLIEPGLDPEDVLTINPAWGTADNSARWRGHGTRMAGIALMGDLMPVLSSNAQITLTHRLESVRILPPDNAPHNDPQLYGALTGEAVARSEVQAPDRKRVIAMAVTASEVRRGRPSSWSAAVDQLCFEEPTRLVVLAAGNIRDDLLPADLYVRNDVASIEDPGQAWNALTVGAYTDKDTIADPQYANWNAFSPVGEISPRSRTSVSWDRQWPIKPDIVLEGGNLATDGTVPGAAIDDLQLLTTHNRPNIRMFNTLGDTSSAVALVGNMAGQIISARPGLWPETVRGLIIHSAEWTPAMRFRLDQCNGRKGQMQALVRRYGFGVPDVQRALLSASNDLTLMVEDALQPFDRNGNASPTMGEMNLHELPWPREQLAALGAAEVELRVTLSYFIEPNPGERGWTRRHRYASHGLRFEVKRSTESVGEFRRRINEAADVEEDLEGDLGAGGGGGDDWLLGPLLRNRGSVHSDYWVGTAADLASRDAIGVFPVGGWWKEKPFLERWNAQARYSLVVTIRAPNSEVDIYTPVAAMIAVPIEVGGI